MSASTDLFAGLPGSQQPAGGGIDLPWSLDRAIGTFLNRWAWRTDREVVERELRELIAEAKRRA